MKYILQQVSLLKKVDAVVQALLFAILTLVWLAKQDDIATYMTVMGFYHALSCIAWATYFRGDTPRFSAGTAIRRTFLFILIGMALSVFTPIVFLCLFILLYVGPVLGLGYFIVTLLEADFYSKARKPFYLL